MRVDRRALALGLVLTAAGAPAFLFIRDPLGGMLGFSLVVTGVFIAVVAAERAVPAPAVQALVEGASDELGTASTGLGLKGQPVYVHDQGNVGAERLFLPASKTGKGPVPILDPDTVAYAGAGGTRVGIALPPAGLALLDAHEAAAGARLTAASLPEIESFLKGLGSSHDLMRGVRVTEDEAGLRARFAAAAVEPPCLATPADPPCEQAGCALCQLVGCAIARGIERPVAVDSAEVDTPWVTLRLVPEERDRDQTPAEDGP